MFLTVASILQRGSKTPINKVIGNESFIAKFGRHPQPADSECTRIQVHLAHVEDRLRAKPSSSLSVESRILRATLLDALHTYAQAGVFPQNTETMNRNPVFIDSNGRPCAVAHLIQQSGHSMLAAKVDASFHLAYLEDVCSTDSPLAHELTTWALAHGFDLGELAQIQPGYTPAEQCVLLSAAGIWAIGGIVFPISTLAMGIWAAFAQWPCVATVQFIVGAALALVLLWMALLWDLALAACTSWVTTHGRYLRIATFSLFILINLNSIVASVLLSINDVCDATPIEIKVSWAIYLTPILLVLFLWSFVSISICIGKRIQKQRAERRQSQVESSQTYLGQQPMATAGPGMYASWPNASSGPQHSYQNHFYGPQHFYQNPFYFQAGKALFPALSIDAASTSAGSTHGDLEDFDSDSD